MHSTCRKVDLGYFEIDANLTREPGRFRNLKARAIDAVAKPLSSWTFTTPALCFLKMHCTLLDRRFPDECNAYKTV